MMMIINTNNELLETDVTKVSLVATSQPAATLPFALSNNVGQDLARIEISLIALSNYTYS